MYGQILTLSYNGKIKGASCLITKHSSTIRDYNICMISFQGQILTRWVFFLKRCPTLGINPVYQTIHMHKYPDSKQLSECHRIEPATRSAAVGCHRAKCVVYTSSTLTLTSKYTKIIITFRYRPSAIPLK